MEVHGNVRESFNTSQKEKMANPVLLVFLSLKSRIISITLWKEEDERKKEKREGRKRFIFLIPKCCGERGRMERGKEIT